MPKTFLLTVYRCRVTEDRNVDQYIEKLDIALLLKTVGIVMLVSMNHINICTSNMVGVPSLLQP